MADPAWTWTLHKEIPSSKESGHAMIEELLSAMTAVEWDGRDFFHVQMAAEEAIINAITHGNGESPDKTVELEFKVCREATFLRVKDQGEGFDPDDLPDPRDDDHLECTNGRGVMLIREMMDEVRFNERGNEVEMLKHRETASAE